MSSAAAGPAEMNDLDKRVELIFDRADDLMINKRKYSEAVTKNNITRLDPFVPRNSQTRP
jgi:hypothetical protein